MLVLVDDEEEAAGVEEEAGGDEVAAGVPGGRGLPSRKATYCSRVTLGGVNTGKSNDDEKEVSE